MPSYNVQFNEQVVRRLMPPNSQTVSMVSRDLGIAAPTMYAWKRQFESKGAVASAKSFSPDKWNMKSKLAAIIQSASMNEAVPGSAANTGQFALLGHLDFVCRINPTQSGIHAYSSDFLANRAPSSSARFHRIEHPSWRAQPAWDHA